MTKTFCFLFIIRNNAKSITLRHDCQHVIDFILQALFLFPKLRRSTSFLFAEQSAEIQWIVITNDTRYLIHGIVRSFQ